MWENVFNGGNEELHLACSEGVTLVELDDRLVELARALEVWVPLAQERRELPCGLPVAIWCAVQN